MVLSSPKLFEFFTQIHEFRYVKAHENYNLRVAIRLICFQVNDSRTCPRIKSYFKFVYQQSVLMITFLIYDFPSFHFDVSF